MIPADYIAEFAAILAREYDENPAYRKAVDAYTSRRQTTAKQMTSAIAATSEACLLSGETEDDPTPAALAPVAGAGLGGGR